MKDMNCPEEMEEETTGECGDLYPQCSFSLPVNNSNNIASFAIREIDEDNYDEECPLQIAPLQVLPPFTQKVDLQQSRVLQV